MSKGGPSVSHPLPGITGKLGEKFALFDESLTLGVVDYFLKPAPVLSVRQFDIGGEHERVEGSPPLMELEVTTASPRQ